MFAYEKSKQKQVSKSTVQKKETEKSIAKTNLTGISDDTKLRLENLSGFSFDDVRTHYNSDKPAQLQSLAYTQCVVQMVRCAHCGKDPCDKSNKKCSKLKPNPVSKLPTKAESNPVLKPHPKEKPKITGDGNCLYHAVYRAMNPTADPNKGAGLRTQALKWFNQSDENTQNNILAFIYTGENYDGVEVDYANPAHGIYRDIALGRIRHVIGTNSAWGGQAGDLSAYILAQALNIQLTIVNERGGLPQNFGVGTRNFTIYYNGVDHYEDTPSPTIKKQEVDKKTTEQKGEITKATPEMQTSLSEKKDSVDDILKDEAVSNIVLGDGWNNPILVESVGRMSWEKVKGQWDLLKSMLTDVGQGDIIKRFVLVRLRNRNQFENDKKDGKVSKFTSYSKWPEMLHPKKQEGYKWGTETEGGGGIRVILKKEYQYDDSKPDEKLGKKKLIEKELSYLKRTALVRTSYGTLTIDNVMSFLEKLLTDKMVELPTEVASYPKSGKLESLNREYVLGQEKRTEDTWPVVMKAEAKNQLVAKCGEPVAISRFNKYFNVIGVVDTPIHKKPQHVTRSGQPENRISMGKELMDTSKALRIDRATTGKKILSDKPKTSLEFLRSPDMSRENVATLEGYADTIRDQLTSKLKKEVKFADDHLNAIIIPSSGVPREIGGYTLLTPMTNAFPLIPLITKKGGEVTILRENR